jgi:tagatose-1,6-bisphosphate aldolase non-catalytic subunit AgaZ/GatZ
MKIDGMGRGSGPAGGSGRAGGGTYDFNTWQETEASLTMQESLGGDDVLFEGYAGRPTHRKHMDVIRACAGRPAAATHTRALSVQHATRLAAQSHPSPPRTAHTRA